MITASAKRVVIAAALSGCLHLATSTPAVALSPVPTARIVTVPGPGRPVVVRVLEGNGNLDNEFVAYDGFEGGAFVATGGFGNGGQIVVGPDEGGGPHVRIFSIDGVLTHEFVAYDAAFRGGVRVAAADMNGDGQISEIVTGAGPGGGPHVRIFDADGRSLFEFMAFDQDFTGGVYVAAGNLDSDAGYEIVVGAGAGGGPHVKVFNMTCGEKGCAVAPMNDGFYAYDSGFAGGVRVSVSDLDDAIGNEIVTAAGPGGGPHVRAFTAGGVPTPTSFYSYDPTFRGGAFVTGDYIRARSAVFGAGEGGGPHVHVVYREGVPDRDDFYAYEPNFHGGVRVAIGNRFDQ